MHAICVSGHNMLGRFYSLQLIVTSLIEIALMQEETRAKTWYKHSYLHNRWGGWWCFFIFWTEYMYRWSKEI